MALPDEGFTLGDASDQEAVCSRAAKKTPPAAVCRGRPSLRAESLPECDVERSIGDVPCWFSLVIADPLGTGVYVPERHSFGLTVYVNNPII